MQRAHLLVDDNQAHEATTVLIELDLLQKEGLMACLVDEYVQARISGQAH